MLCSSIPCLSSNLRRRKRSFSSVPTCRDDLDPVRTDTLLTDTELPVAGKGFHYLITAEDFDGEEGTLGLGTAAERSNFVPCP